jgi:hypothetical protein
MPVRLKSSDESRASDTTLADDSSLTVSLAASSIYFVEICVVFAAAAASAIKIAGFYTGTLTDATMQFMGCPANLSHGGSSWAPRAFSANAAFLTTPVVLAIAGSDTASTAGVWYVRGVIRTNSAGTLKVQWAQNVSGAGNSTVRAGSYIRYTLQANMPGTLIVKTSNEARSSNATYAADSDLVLPVEATKSYIGEMMFTQSTPGNPPAIKYQMTDPNVDAAVGLTNRSIVGENTQPSAASGNIQGSWQAAFFTTPYQGSYTTANRQYAAWGLIQGASDDSVDLEWAQLTSNAAATTMLTPSWIWQEEVD